MYGWSSVTSKVLGDGPIQHIHIQLGCWQNLVVDIHPPLYQFHLYTIFFSQVQRDFVENDTLSLLLTLDADCWKDLSLIEMPKKKTCRIFFIQMSSFMLSINKTDFPLTAPVINPFELLIIFFSCFLVSKAIHFFHLIILLLFLLPYENSKFLRILFGLTFRTWIS